MKKLLALTLFVTFMAVGISAAVMDELIMKRKGAQYVKNLRV